MRHFTNLFYQVEMLKNKNIIYITTDEQYKYFCPKHNRYLKQLVRHAGIKTFFKNQLCEIQLIKHHYIRYQQNMAEDIYVKREVIIQTPIAQFLILPMTKRFANNY